MASPAVVVGRRRRAADAIVGPQEDDMRIPILALAVVTLLTSCASPAPTATTVSPTAMVTVGVTSPSSPPVSGTFTPTVTSKPTIWYTPSPYPTIPLSFVPLEPVYLEHWKEYEHALAKELKRMSPPEKVLCEWVILGRTKQSIYVWALCAEHLQGDFYPGVSVPAVIDLDADGKVVDVKTPRPGADYGPSIRRVFPKDVQEKIFNFQAWLDVDQLKTHLIYRFDHPETPPLIVLSATPMP